MVSVHSPDCLRLRNRQYPSSGKGTAMREVDLRADCSRCAALCCVVLPFDQSAAFGFSKAAGVPCRHLAPENRCNIHSRLADGFSGCVQFDCHGAGQRVTQQVFGGQSWRDDPALAGPMENAFRAMRKLHEAVLLLLEAAHLPLSPAQEQTRLNLIAALDPKRQRCEAELAAFETAPVLGDVRDFLATLRDTARVMQPHR